MALSACRRAAAPCCLAVALLCGGLCPTSAHKRGAVGAAHSGQWPHGFRGCGSDDINNIRAINARLKTSHEFYLEMPSIGAAVALRAGGMNALNQSVAHPEWDSRNESLRLRLLVLMVLQNSATALVARYTRSSVAEKDMFAVNDLIICCEITKLIVSGILESCTSDCGLVQSVKGNMLGQPLEFFAIVIPSLLFLMQNSILYVAVSNLSVPLFQVTYQMKLVTTAIMSMFLLQRRYSAKQMTCLTTLSVGVAIVLVDGNRRPEKQNRNSNESIAIGLLAVMAASVSSAVAGIVLEKLLKGRAFEAKKNQNLSGTLPLTSLWMRNMHMAFFSICIALLHRCICASNRKSFMHGFSPWVHLLVVLQAGGGLLVAAVMKYADNVLKGLATGVSVVLSAVVSSAFFGTPITRHFLVGSCIVLLSVYLFSNDLHVPDFIVRTHKKNDIIT